MAREFRTLDVFTTETFGGNPLAVVMDGQGLSTEEMQTIAAEFNLSETTFVLPAEDAANDAHVRIFTPKAELPFAGHPTVGTAIVLAGEKHGGAYETELQLEMKVGLVRVKVSRQAGEAAYAQFSAAALPEDGEAAPSVAATAAAIGLTEGDIGFERHTVRTAVAGNAFVFVPVKHMEALSRAWPDMTAWRAAGFPDGTVGVFAYTRGGEGPEADWRGRMYGPDHGIMEDPATGSAVATFPGQVHACENLADGTHKWMIEQGYEMGRPSQLYVEADIAGGEITAVRVGGHAVPVIEGQLTV